MNDTTDSALLDPSTAVELAPPRDNAVMPGFVNESSWKLANRIGQAFAASSLVPEAYRGNVANCIVALEMANRLGASPLMVMQNLYIVHGNPGWSSKFLIACFNQSGRFSAMRYEWNQARTECRAWATEKATGEKLVGPLVSIDMAGKEGWSTKSGSKWKTMPELMLMYRSAAFFVRTYAPEISMGLRTDDEIVDTVEASRPTNRLDMVRSALAADPVTGELPAPKSSSNGTSNEPAKEGHAPPTRSYAVLAEQLQKLALPGDRALLLDEARSLPVEQYAELCALAKRMEGDK